MRDDIFKEVSQRIAAEFKFEAKGEWLQKGKCPKCGRKEVFTKADAPWVLKCGRLDKCGWDGHVKDLYSDIFDNWSNRYKASESNPTAAADAYLHYARGFDLQGLRGCYSEETYRDRARNLTSATVRFQLPGGSYWERLIDQPGRFDKKAHFAWGKPWKGHAWTAPDQDIAAIAKAERLWIVEGIFDALSFRQVGEFAASAMSCNNYPDIFLKELRKAIADLGIVGGPELIFAFDVGKAGVEYTRKFVKLAREQGWRATAAQVNSEGEGDKRDWNDLLSRKRLEPDHLTEYLWNGEVLIAPNATEKACLIYGRKNWSSFSFVHDSRTWWAHFNEARIAEVQVKEGITKKAAAKGCANVEEIANCAFRVLYFQRDEATDESQYYLRVDSPSDRPASKAAFSPASLSAGAEFKKRLLAVSPGGQWTGTTEQLDRLISGQTSRIKIVETIDFTGYSRDHAAWVLGDIAIKDGRVVRLNDEDYFDFGKMSLKLRSNERILSIDYDPDVFHAKWLVDVWVAWGTNGLVTVAFWFMSLFAEQIRQQQKSLAFLEMTGDPGTGKSTLIEFLWKLLGRENYEGFDPQKATTAALARNLGKVANMPVVLIEGDHNDKAVHAKRFEWDELKTAYNGRSVRSRGVKSGGNETYEPPFRAAIIIEQNNAVMASPATLERIMQLRFDKAHFNAATKSAAERIEQWPTEEISGFIVHAARRENDVLRIFRESFLKAEQEFEQRGEVRHVRIIKNHSQLIGALEAMASILPIPDAALHQTRERIFRMAAERKAAISADHDVVQKFWELFDWIQSNEEDTLDPKHRINQHRKPEDFIAVALPHFEEKCRHRGLTAPSTDDLKKYLKTSKRRKFFKADTVNGVGDKHIHCWIFEQPKAADSRSSKGSNA